MKRLGHGQNTITQGSDATIALAGVAHWQMAKGSDLDPGKTIGPDLDVLVKKSEDEPEDLRTAIRFEKNRTATAFPDWSTGFCPACK